MCVIYCISSIAYCPLPFEVVDCEAVCREGCAQYNLKRTRSGHDDTEWPFVGCEWAHEGGK